MPPSVRKCVDCLSEGLANRRKAPYPGPRCATHHRLVRKQRSSGTWEQRIIATYAINAEEYQAVLDHQNGTCAICRRAYGLKKRLSVDHDHATGFNRGLLCQRCNVFLGYIRDEAEAGERLADYLRNPPAFRVIGKRYAPVTGQEPKPRYRNKPKRVRNSGNGEIPLDQEPKI